METKVVNGIKYTTYWFNAFDKITIVCVCVLKYESINFAWQQE